MPDINEKIKLLKKEKNAVVLAHTYQPAEVQDIADYVGDSYGLSVEAANTDADIIIFCGVMFMAETAAILNPEKKVIIPVPDAGCPMADMIETVDLIDLKKEYPEHLVMCYVNSTAEIKALSDICCTSSNAVKIARQLPEDRGVIFVPDKHLGGYVGELTGRRMVLWEGFCPTHLRITPEKLENARNEHSEAVLMIHPEAAKACRDISDQVLSTGGMCKFVGESDAMEFIVATETGLIHTLEKENPEKKFYPISGSITCPNMKKGSIEATLKALEGNGGAIVNVDKETARKAKGSLIKMLEMSR